SSDYLQREMLLDRLEEMAARGRLLLVLEDLHWADSSTVATLPALARRLEGLPLLVVVTVRPLPREPELAAVLRRLEATSLVLGPLSDADAALLAVQEGARDVRAVVARCGGNPFFVGELARARHDGGSAATELPADVVQAVLEPRWAQCREP